MKYKIKYVIIVLFVAIVMILYKGVLSYISTNFNISNEILAVFENPFLLLFSIGMIAGGVWAVKHKQKPTFIVCLMLLSLIVGLILAHIGSTAVIGIFLATVPCVIACIYMLKCIVTNTGFKKQMSTASRIAFGLLLSLLLAVSIYFVNIGAKDAIVGAKISKLYNCYIIKESQLRSGGPEYDYLIGTDENGKEYKLKILDWYSDNIEDTMKVKFYENMKIVIEILH